MKKILVDSDRLKLLLDIANLSGKCILIDGSINGCIYTHCTCCIFFDKLNCGFDSCDYKYLIGWLKGD